MKDVSLNRPFHPKYASQPALRADCTPSSESATCHIEIIYKDNTRFNIRKCLVWSEAGDNLQLVYSQTIDGFILQDIKMTIPTSELFAIVVTKGNNTVIRHFQHGKKAIKIDVGMKSE